MLATLIKTLGSTPQKIGSRILIKADQSIVGTVGGGCVEGDIWFQALNMLKSNQHFALHDYILNEELAAEDGLTCGGTVKFMLENVSHPQSSIETALDAMANAERSGEPVTIATILKCPENSNFKVGEHLILDEQTLGQTANYANCDLVQLEKIYQLAQTQLGAGGSLHFESDDKSYEIFVTVQVAPATVLILGAGHVGKAVATLANDFLDFRVIVVDDRQEFANRDNFPNVHAVHSGDYAEVIAALGVNRNWNIVIVTRGHRQDLDALLAALSTEADYIGLMGSKRKGILLLKELRQRGHSKAQIERLHTPMGLKIGAVTPQEIALSVIAEILAHSTAQTGTHAKLNRQMVAKAIAGSN